jgi:hypothetical protein
VVAVSSQHADAVAHAVVSGRSAEPLLNEMAPAGPRALGVQRQVVQRTPLETDYGKFDTTKYADVGTVGSEEGVDMELTFDPDPVKANAKKIGLTQSVRVNLGGTNTGWYPVEKNRMVPSGVGEGSQIDRLGVRPYGNPLFAANAPAATDKLGDTATVPNWGQHGWNYKDGNANKHQTAILKDKPTAPGRGNNSSQTFETAALAVEGVQSGKYMGSVSWGWNVDGAGKFTRRPLKLESKGDPTAGFIAAAKQWNKTSVGGTIKTTADPTTVYNASFAPAFTVDKDTEVEVTKGSWIHNNMTYDLVKIKGGQKAGTPGLLKVNDMNETGGTAAIKLPTP